MPSTASTIPPQQVASSTKPQSKKRKLSTPAPAAAPDARFAFSAEDLDEGPLETAEDEGFLEEDDTELGDALAGPSTAVVEGSNPLPAHLLPSKGKAHGIPGLIYLSRIPPGMGPSKVKHLLSAFGEVGRVFLARSDPDPPQDLSSHKRQKDKHREHRFAEGWIEFMDKRVARTVAEMLNARNIGGKKGTRWRDDVWTMKYLPRFRWDMLSEQVGTPLFLKPPFKPFADLTALHRFSLPSALERATQTSLLRFHLQHSRTEQESYLSAVEKARVSTAIELKAEGRREGKRIKVAEGGEVAVEGEVKEKKKRERSYRQREVLETGGKKKEGSKADLDGVLSRLF